MELKKPLGELWIGEIEANLRRLNKLLEKKKPTCLATVGDYVSSHILDAGLQPNIVIIDHRIMREYIEPIELDRECVNVVNEPGTISAESQSVLKNIAKECRNLAIIVTGEEDLLVLPLMAYMPLNSIIIYGQPNEGMVVITLSPERREWGQKFMSKMKKG